MRQVTYGPGPTTPPHADVTFGPGSRFDATRVPARAFYGLGAELPQPLATGAAGLGTGLIGMGGSAVYGGAIGGIAAKSWKGSATGAIAGATASALSYGIYAGIGRMFVPMGVFLAAGLGGAAWTYMRWKKGSRRRRR